MLRTGFRTSAPARDPDRVRAVPKPVPGAFRMGQPVGSSPTSTPLPKRQPAKRAEPGPRIRESAKGEQCEMRLPGCPGNPEMTIWSHYRGSAGGKGGAIKALDVCGAFTCVFCDAIYDGNAPRPAGMTKADVDAAWHDAHIRSLVKLNQKGLV